MYIYNDCVALKLIRQQIADLTGDRLLAGANG